MAFRISAGSKDNYDAIINPNIWAISDKLGSIVSAVPFNHEARNSSNRRKKPAKPKDHQKEQQENVIQHDREPDISKVQKRIHNANQKSRGASTRNNIMHYEKNEGNNHHLNGNASHKHWNDAPFMHSQPFACNRFHNSARNYSQSHRNSTFVDETPQNSAWKFEKGQQFQNPVATMTHQFIGLLQQFLDQLQAQQGGY